MRIVPSHAAILLILLALGLASPLAVASDDISKVNGSIRTESGTAYRDLDTVNGSIHLAKGVQARGVETVNGGIGLVGTEVGRNVETVNGDITVGIGSHVKGGIRVTKPSFSLSLTPPRKPRIIIGPNATVDGTLNFEREVTLYVHDSASIGPVSGATVRRFDTEAAPKD